MATRDVMGVRGWSEPNSAEPDSTRCDGAVPAGLTVDPCSEPAREKLACSAGCVDLRDSRCRASSWLLLHLRLALTEAELVSFVIGYRQLLRGQAGQNHRLSRDDLFPCTTAGNVSKGQGRPTSVRCRCFQW